VRNSIILVDFIELRLSAAVVVGSAAILFDPICLGLAIALMAGEIASLLLSANDRADRIRLLPTGAR
jgi:hypothetical protein